MQTLFKSNLFSSSSSKMGAKSLLSGGKKLGSSIVGAAKNNIVNFARSAKAMVPQKKEEKENNFIKNYTNFFGSKKTEKILRKNLKLVRDSLVNTFEIAKLLKASIVSITKNLKGGFGKGGGLGGIFGFLSGAVGLIGLLTNPFVLGFLGILAAGGVTALLLNQQNYTMVPKINAFLGTIEHGGNYMWAVSSVVSATAPLFMIIWFFQRQLISGLIAGAVKG